MARFLEVIPLTKLTNETSTEETRGPEIIRNVIGSSTSTTTELPKPTENSTFLSTDTPQASTTRPIEATTSTPTTTNEPEPSTKASLPILIINATIGTSEKNSTVKLIDSSIENLSYDIAKDFIQRNFKTAQLKRKKRCADDDDDGYKPCGCGCPKRR